VINMNKKQENFSKIIIVVVRLLVVVAILLVIFYFVFTILSLKEDKENCVDRLRAIYEVDDSSAYHQYVDETHYNCCWDEVELSDDGYYTKRKCRGFVRDE